MHLPPDLIEQLEHGQPKGIRNNLDGIQRRVRQSSFYPTQIGLVVAALDHLFGPPAACRKEKAPDASGAYKFWW